MGAWVGESDSAAHPLFGNDAADALQRRGGGACQPTPRYRPQPGWPKGRGPVQFSTKYATFTVVGEVGALLM